MQLLFPPFSCNLVYDYTDSEARPVHININYNNIIVLHFVGPLKLLYESSMCY